MELGYCSERRTVLGVTSFPCSGDIKEKEGKRRKKKLGEGNGFREKSREREMGMDR